MRHTALWFLKSLKSASEKPYNNNRTRQDLKLKPHKIKTLKRISQIWNEGVKTELSRISPPPLGLGLVLAYNLHD